MAVLGLLGVYLVTKFKTSCSWELFLSNVFMYCKFAFILLFILSDGRVAFYYVLFCFILWLVSAYPKYDKASKIIKVQSRDHLCELLNMDDE